MLSPPEAEAAIATHVPAAPQAVLSLASLVGRPLRQTVIAERDQPPFDRASMDGVAIASAFHVSSTTSLAVGASPFASTRAPAMGISFAAPRTSLGLYL